MPEDSPICALCERTVPKLTRHHLFPRSIGRRKGLKPTELATTDLCGACHRQIHVLFDNHRLAASLDSIDAIRAEPEMQKFLNWVRRQPVERSVKVRRRSER